MNDISKNFIKWEPLSSENAKNIPKVGTYYLFFCHIFITIKKPVILRKMVSNRIVKNAPNKFLLA